MGKYILKQSCGYKGCKDNLLLNYTSKRDYNDAVKRYANYHCMKHSRPADVIEAVDGAKRTIKYEVIDGKFKRIYHDTPPQKNIIGRGFRLFAEDFPEGAKIEINIEVTLPDPFFDEVMEIVKRKGKFLYDDKDGNTLEIGEFHGSDLGVWFNGEPMTIGADDKFTFSIFKRKYLTLNHENKMDVRHLQGNTYQAFLNDNCVYQGSQIDCESFLKIQEIKGKNMVYFLSYSDYQIYDESDSLMFQGDITECYNFLLKHNEQI